MTRSDYYSCITSRCHYDDVDTTFWRSSSNEIPNLVKYSRTFSRTADIPLMNFVLVVNGMHIHWLIWSINCTSHFVYLLFHSVLWFLPIRELFEFYGVHYQPNTYYMMINVLLMRVNIHCQVKNRRKIFFLLFSLDKLDRILFHLLKVKQTNRISTDRCTMQLV